MPAGATIDGWGARVAPADMTMEAAQTGGIAMQMPVPNAWRVALFALLVGGTLGGGSRALTAALRPWRLGEFDPAKPGNSVPRVEAPSTQYSFGTMAEGAEETHEFIIGNSGEANLTITRGATSCSCTVSDFEDSAGGDSDGEKAVAPGAAARLRLRWRGKQGGPFRQQATVFTNDPRRPEIAFVIEGTVVPVWKAEPKSIVLTRISASGGEQASARIFTYGKEAPSVDSVSSPDSENSQFVSFTTEPLPAEEVAKEAGATGGFTLNVAILPGVPIGPLRKTVSVALRVPEEVTAEVVVEGTVTGDLALAGQGWDSSRQALQLGTVSGRAGQHIQLFITAKGPHRDAVRPVVREVVPASMLVEVGESKAVGTSAVVRIPLTITIPAGSPPCNHIGSKQAPAGRIILDTGHPDSPTMSIPVCVTIGP